MPPRPAIPPSDITGLVLAGGLGRRMGGVEKGLIDFGGEALAERAARRLGGQVGRVAISANRELGRYADFADAVWPDARLDGIDPRAGPLLGLLTAMLRAESAFVATVPCDAPGFPHDLVARLVAARHEAGSVLALAATAHGEVWRAEPVFCLAPRALADDLRRFLAEGGRRVGAWCERHPCALARFADAAAFANLNTPDELTSARSNPGSDEG